MGKNSINIDLDDPRTGKIATAISNKTCKKILGLLVEEELSEADLAKKLKVPINTVEYNLKKLIEGGLIEKTKNYFWSVKGKKIPVYRVSNKKIVIYPKKLTRGVLPAVLVSGIVALVLRVNFAGRSVSSAESIARDTASVGEHIIRQSPIWIWFLAGAFFSLIVYFSWNWTFRKK